MNNILMLNTVAKLMLLLVVAAPASGQPLEGFDPYLEMKDQFVLELPRGWSAFDQTLILTGKQGKTSSTPVVFSAETIDGSAMKSNDRQSIMKIASQLARVEVGLTGGFMLDRLPAKNGMSCSGFDNNAQAQLVKLMGTDPMFGPERTIREKPHAEPISIGGCQGLRIKGKGTASTGAGKTLDVFAVADGEVLFLFELLNLDEHYPKNIGTLEQIISTLKLAVAKRGE